jgi:hypothetical protein
MQALNWRPVALHSMFHGIAGFTPFDLTFLVLLRVVKR